MAESNKKCTQKEVAQRAGVSQAVVSHVVNDTDKAIPEATRQRVINAMQELGYTPNKAARSLRAQKSLNIACIVPDITNAFYPAFLRGVQTVADQNNYDLIIYDSYNSKTKELHYLKTLGAGHLDGAITVLFHKDSEIIADLFDKNFHLVTLEDAHPVPGSHLHDVIYVDNVSAARAAVNHLINLGHVQIGMISGTAGTPPQNSRLLGYQQALSAHNIVFREYYICNGDYTEKDGYTEMKKLLSLPACPTAVFAANDLMAIGAIMAVRDHGLRVPQDISIMGFDDIPAARLVSPGLTTVNQFQEQIGLRAAGLLLERLNGNLSGGPQFVEMPFEIVVRESTSMIDVDKAVNIKRESTV